MDAIFLLGMPGGSEMFIILAVLLLLFGGSRLPQLAKGLGQSINEFKKGVAQLEDGAGLEGQARPQARLQAGGRAGAGTDEVTRDARVAAGRA
jgi:sec-independent protein translocase protein TatA